MAIKVDRTAPTSVKIWDDEFGDKEHLVVSQTNDGTWALISRGPASSSQLGEFRTASEAVDTAVQRLQGAIDELDDAIGSIGER